MHRITQTLVNLINHSLPNQCLLCAAGLQTNDLLCSNCHYDLPHVYGQHLCRQCGLGSDSLNDFCGHCLSHPPAFERSFIPFAYEYPLDGLIHKFKYRRHLTSGKLLGQLLADYLKHYAQEHEDWIAPDVIIPVPMHWLKRWQRGFNQAEFLGRQVALALDLPLVCGIIQRTHKTPAQKELTRSERQKNLRKAFRILAHNRTQITGKRIALIDDVVTTTATVRELSQLLVKAGAKEVQVWALARTMERR